MTFSETSLLWSVLLDDFIAANLFNSDFFENFFQTVLNNPYFFEEEDIWYSDMLDFLLIQIGFLNELADLYSSSIDQAILNDIISEDPTTLPKIVIDFLLLLVFFYIFFSMYFSYYNNATKEYSLIDHDYLLASTAVEAEEEISSWDDMILAALLIIFIFLWYFGINTLMVVTNAPEFYLSMYIFPALYFLIMLIPAFLAYDFGIYFVSYLRGKGDSTVSSVELMYDYISFASFYIRLVVQNVRLLLMTFTFASFHEIIMIHEINRGILSGDESFSEIFSNDSSLINTCFHFMAKISNHIIYFFYELIHLLFVVTAQIIAFHAMVFWLFLFLYTMFSTELHEKFFFQKRLAYKNKSTRYFNFKNSYFIK